MEPIEPELTIVTLTRDNITELALTLRSVTLQARRPSRHIVIDGSSRENAKAANALALAAGSEYVWHEPQGIYEAMDYSMSLLQGDGFVMWLNSSDWLAGPRVVERIFQELSSLEPEKAWIIGQLLRRGSEELSFHKALWQTERFASLMEIGWTGFPHPSTVFRIRALHEVGGFAEGAQFRVARDYDLALRMLSSQGKPRILRAIFSVHVPAGFTSKMVARGFIERVESRLVRLSWPIKVTSLLVSPFLAFVAVYRKQVTDNKLDPSSISEGSILGHYCEENMQRDWPYCCDESLDVRSTYPRLRGV